MNLNEFKRKMKKVLFYILGAFLFITVLAMVFFYNANYSEGYRAGIVIKMSNKGYLFKTQEGQLDVEGLNTQGQGTMTSVWNFSVDDDNPELIEKLNQVSLSKQRVQLKYEEKFIKIFWRGDTKYFVTDIIEQKPELEKDSSQ